MSRLEKIMRGGHHPCAGISIKPMRKRHAEETFLFTDNACVKRKVDWILQDGWEQPSAGTIPAWLLIQGIRHSVPSKMGRAKAEAGAGPESAGGECTMLAGWKSLTEMVMLAATLKKK